MKSTARKRGEVLFTVERRVAIGEVIAGEGNQPPVPAGLSIIAQELEVARERAWSNVNPDDYALAGDDACPSMHDAFAFEWEGHTYSVTVAPTN